MAKPANYEWQIYGDKLRGYRWKFVNLNNGKNMANGSESYANKYSCKRSLLNVARFFGPTAPIKDTTINKYITPKERLY